MSVHPVPDRARSGTYPCAAGGAPLPLRRTTLAVLLATGVLAGAYAAPAAAAVEPRAVARSAVDTDSGDGEVVTISLSSDAHLVGELTGAARAARLQWLEARRAQRTEHALRIAAMLNATQGGFVVRPPEPVAVAVAIADPSPARRVTGDAQPAPTAPPREAPVITDPPPKPPPHGASRTARASAAAPAPDLATTAAPSPRRDWDAVTRQAAQRMRARTLLERPALPARQAGRFTTASLASASPGHVTLGSMLEAERFRPGFATRRETRLHLGEPGAGDDRAGDVGDVGGEPDPSAALYPSAQRLAATIAGSPAEIAGRWMRAAPNPTGDGELSPKGDLRPIFLAAVEAAFARSPDVQLAYATYKAQLADVDEAKGRRWPQLQLSSNSKALEFGGASGNRLNRGMAVTANVTTPVFDWGYLSSTIGSREQTADAGKEYYDAQRENSAYTVTTTLAELAKQRLLIGISQQFVDRMQQLVTMLSQIVAVDHGRESELTQARARLLQAQAARDGVAAKARDTELSLRKLVGDQPLALPNASAWNIAPARLQRLLSSMDAHPQIRQARAEAQAALLQADAVRAASKPALNWVVSKTTGRDEIDRHQPFQTMLTLSWNAFQGGAAKAAQLAAYERARASEQKIRQARLDLEYSIRAADEDARTLLRRADLYGDLVGETDRVRKDFFDQWYHLGKRTLLDVLQAENDHYGNRVSEVTTRFDGYEAVFRELSSAGELMGWLRGTV